MHFLWNRLEHGREDDLSLRPCAHNNYTIDYVHGHDDTPSALEHVTNLDGPQGKFNTPEYNVKEYKVLALNEGSTIKTSAARAGVVTALTAAGISAGVLAAVFVPLLLLTVFAPPLGLGLLAFGLALGGLALAIGFAAGIYKGWKTEKAQTQSNSRSILTPAVHEEANDTGYANSTSLVLARMGVKPTGVDLALPNPPQSAEPTQNKEDIIMVGTGADAQNGVDSESSVVTTMRNIKS